MTHTHIHTFYKWDQTSWSRIRVQTLSLSPGLAYVLSKAGVGRCSGWDRSPRDSAELPGAAGEA